MKRCHCCARLKPYPEFSRDRTQDDGYQQECVACQRERMKAYRRRGTSEGFRTLVRAVLAEPRG